MGPILRSPSLCCTKLFFRSVSLMLHTDDFCFHPFLRVTNVFKLERFQRVASRAIYGCLSSSPIPLILVKTSLPPLRVIPTHFALFFYERAGLSSPNLLFHFRFGQIEDKPRLLRSSWNASGSNHQLLLAPTYPKENSLCLLSLPSLKSTFLHCGANSFLSMLSL